jgi:hypothetical protein
MPWVRLAAIFGDTPHIYQKATTSHLTTSGGPDWFSWLEIDTSLRPSTLIADQCCQWRVMSILVVMANENFQPTVFGNWPTSMKNDL